MEDNIKKVKTSILKRMLGKRVFVVTNHILNEGYCGNVEKVIDHETLLVLNEKGESKINIFDIRTPSRIYNCE